MVAATVLIALLSLALTKSPLAMPVPVNRRR